MADTATQDEKAAKEAERAEKQRVAEEARAAKAKEREEAKARKAKEAADAKAKRDQEKIDKVLSEGGVDIKDVTGTGDGGAVTLKDARDAVKAKKAEERANRPKKASLTLSQRRAVLNLADAGSKGIVPKTGFNALPLEHLVSVGLAETFATKKDQVTKVTEGEGDEKKTVEKTTKVDATGFRLTDSGKERAGEINPKWKTWKPTPVEDSTPAEAPEETVAS